VVGFRYEIGINPTVEKENERTNGSSDKAKVRNIYRTELTGAGFWIDSECPCFTGK
jgi:hypothetical protein